jgi:hypothetical protein
MTPEERARHLTEIQERAAERLVREIPNPVARIGSEVIVRQLEKLRYTLSSEGLITVDEYLIILEIFVDSQKEYRAFRKAELDAELKEKLERP